MAVIIGVARETAAGERRVALTPETCRKFVAAGATVRIERGLGRDAHFPDPAYAEAGAQLVENADAALSTADLVLCVQPPPADMIARLQDAEAVGHVMQPGRTITVGHQHGVYRPLFKSCGIRKTGPAVGALRPHAACAMDGLRGI